MFEPNITYMCPPEAVQDWELVAYALILEFKAEAGRSLRLFQVSQSYSVRYFSQV